ncbi:hypothetical protein [Streptomyces sp. NPDC020298]|uniref:hypothetical protein n=1 Tax=unclassified Streptomyces TaxID=2593676 RepID=UPI0033F05975
MTAKPGMAAGFETPYGCRHCGVDQREHAWRWKPPVGWHQWTPATQEQIKARMRARRASKEAQDG